MNAFPIEERQTALNSLYQRFSDESAIIEACGGNKDLASELRRTLEGPFLINISQAYAVSNPRVVIVGQENNGWVGPYAEFLSSSSVAKYLDEYKNFGLEVQYNHTFFQYFAKIRDELHKLVGSGVENPKAVPWLNLFKLNQGMRPQMINSTFKANVLALQHDIFEKELRLLEPEVVVFLTGPYYDEVIKHYYPNTHFEQFTEFPARQVARVVHPNLPALTFRTYHPNYLNRFKKRNEHCLSSIYQAISMTRQSGKS